MELTYYYLNMLGSFVLLVIGFGLVIFVHEFGHFIVAKWVGVKVTQFAIGFGPAAIAYRKGLGVRVGSTEAEYEQRIKADPAAAMELGETEYRANWVPLGGYVKMLGQEDLDPAAQSDDPRAFGRKPIWARACVISAGVIMNLIFGVIFFIIAFTHGVKFNPPVVGDVGIDTPAATVYAQGHAGDQAYKGLRAGDTVLSVSGDPVTDFGDLAVKIALSPKDQPLSIVVERPADDFGISGGDSHKTNLTFVMTPVADPELKLLSLGIMRANSLKVGEKNATLPPELKDVGVDRDWAATSVNGHSIDRFDQFIHGVEAGHGKPVAVTFANAAGDKSVQVALRALPNMMIDKKESSDPTAAPIYTAHLIGLVPATKVEGVVPKSPAELAGVQRGDLIARLNTVLWPDIRVAMETIKSAGDRPIEIDVFRNGQTVTLLPAKRNPAGQIGVLLQSAVDTTFVSQTLPNSAAVALNLNAGSRIVSINGQSVASYGDMQRMLAEAVTPESVAAIEATSQPSTVNVKIGYQLNAANQPVTEATVALDATTVKAIDEAGWSQPLPSVVFDPALMVLQAHGPIDAAKIGIEKTWQFMVQTWLTVGRLFQQSVSIKQFSGPVGIMHQGTKLTSQGGWAQLLWFLGLISANLAVLNFMPLPILDGGHIMLMIIEKLKGSPVSAKVQVGITYVGLAFFLGLLLYVTYNDVSRMLL